jgi:hypothetical protein
MRATCPVNFILCDVITVIYGEAYNFLLLFIISSSSSSRNSSAELVLRFLPQTSEGNLLRHMAIMHLDFRIRSEEQ